MLSEGPEVFLREVVMSAGLRVRYFPSTFVLGCCSAVARAAGRCFGSRVCIDARRVRTPVSAREVSIAEERLRDPPTTPTFSFSPILSPPLTLTYIIPLSALPLRLDWLPCGGCQVL